MERYVWVLTDERTGTANQALGVAEILGFPLSIKRIQYTILANLPNNILSPGSWTIKSESRVTLVPPWPDIIISAGRRLALVARWLKVMANKCSGTPLLVQLMFPGWRGLADFDIVAVPQHDLLRFGKVPSNITPIVGSPHRVTPAKLANAARHWRSHFDSLPRPRLALLVGGTTKNGSQLTAALTATLATRIILTAGSVLLTTSRRTERSLATTLLSTFKDTNIPLFTYSWEDSPRENPYLGLLSLSDGIVVTGDSVSMCTEACAQEKPVFIFSPPGWLSGKYTILHNELYLRKHAKPFTMMDHTSLKTSWHLPLPNPAQHIAAQVRLYLKKYL